VAVATNHSLNHVAALNLAMIVIQRHAWMVRLEQCVRL
jgi:hypothetical protein